MEMEELNLVELLGTALPIHGLLRFVGNLVDYLIRLCYSDSSFMQSSRIIEDY